jgi:hypothetical protein
MWHSFRPTIEKHGKIVIESRLLDVASISVLHASKVENLMVGVSFIEV